MSFNKIILIASAIALSAVANAQTLNTKLQAPKKVERKLSRFDVQKQSDKQIKEIGEKVSANGLPTKASAQKMFKAAMSKNGSKMHKAMKAASQKKAKYTANDTIFWESFEGWDGESMPWIPTNENNWSSQSNISNITPYISNGGCPTWTVFDGDGYYIPYATDRDQFLVCMFGEEVYGTDGTSVIAPAPQQDEWLVSPVINSVKGTNYLSFDINYAAWNTHYFITDKDSVFDTSRVAYDVEVLVTTSTRSVSFDEDNYTCVYKLSTEVDKELATIDMNDNEAVAQLLYMKWRHIQIPLTDFEDSNIRIALRYTGYKGGSVLIDALRVSDLLPVALFSRPEGSFFLGYSNEAAILTAQVALMPAYRESVWKNLSNDDAKTFEWRYNVNGTSGTSKEKDLTLPKSEPSSLVEWPTLQATAGLRSDEYKGGNFANIKAGGDAAINLGAETGVINFNLGNFNPTKEIWYASVGEGKSAFGTGGESYWGPISNYEYNKVNGIANIFDAPTSPYVFNTVSQSFEDFFNLGGTLACTVYRAKDLGDGALEITDEVIAQTTTFNENSAGGGKMLVFNFDKPIVVDYPIAISIDGLDDNMVITALPLAQAYNHDDEKGYGFVLLRTQRGGIQWVEIASALTNVEGTGNMATSFCMGMNAIFPYIHSNDGDIYEVPQEGGSKSFDLNTYWNPNGNGADSVDPDWNVTCSESWFNAETIVDETAMTVNIKITVDKMPSTLDGRDGTVTISALGCEETITVLQGAAATNIKNVATNNDLNNEGTYTISGQRINSANAIKGMYIVKKDGKFVKVLK